MTPEKIPSCYTDKTLSTRCPNHYWNSGYGFCKLTGKGVKPETCGKAHYWERDEKQ